MVDPSRVSGFDPAGEPNGGAWEAIKGAAGAIGRLNQPQGGEQAHGRRRPGEVISKEDQLRDMAARGLITQDELKRTHL